MTLFGEIDASAPSSKTTGPFAGVALEQSVDRVLDYAIPPKLAASIRVGQRVKVPLGRNTKPSFNHIGSLHPISDYTRIKKLAAIEDDRVVVAGKMLELAQSMGHYYMTPLGMVIENIIPAAVKRKIGIGYSQMVSLAQGR